MKQQSAQYYSSSVFHGDKAGRTIGFPTLNLDPSIIPQDTKTGVWASEVIINEASYMGALYFGPKTHTTDQSNVLEIFVLEFNQEVYGQTVTFSLKQFIRPVLHFTSLPELTTQLNADIAAVQKVFHDEKTSN